MSGKLYLVATPIGNLEDITLRAIRVLKEADLIAAEDTRHTLKLLNHLEISKPLISYHRHNEEVKSDILIQKLKEGQNIALVSDAGTPVISDPGEEVVKVALEKGIKVEPVPGACAAIAALIASGLKAKEFLFLGFLPLNKKTRKQELEKIKEARQTIILYEAPHKIRNTLTDLKEILLDRTVVLAREITKLHEEYLTGTAEELLNKLQDPRGEFVLVIEQNTEEEKAETNTMSLEEHYQYYEKRGLSKKEIIKKIAKDKEISKNEIYQKFLSK